MTNLTIFGGRITAGVLRRTLAGPVVRYGVYGRTSAGRLKVRAGAALTFPDDLTRVKLTREHDRGESRGYLADLHIDAAGIDVACRVSDGPAGDDALEEARDHTRDGFSFDIIDAVFEGDEIISGTVIAIGQVGIPAFDDMRITQIAASQTPAQQGNPTPVGEKMTPEQRARLAALRAQQNLTDEERTEYAELTDLAVNEAVEPDEAEDPPADAPPADAAPTAAVAASVPAVPGGVPAPGRRPARTRPAGNAWQQMARRITDEWTSRGDLSQGITAALQDIVESAQDVTEQTAWSGELWSGLKYEPLWTDLLNRDTLTNWKGEGWRFTSKMVMQDYAGDKAEIPTDNVSTEASTYEAARMAVGADIDRKFYDFPNESFITSLFEQIRESWEEKLDAKVRAYVIANAAKATRTIVVTTVSGDATVEAPNQSFRSSDVGRSVSGAGIPASTTVLSVTDHNTIELSANATASASGVTMTIDSSDTNILRAVGRLVQSGRSTKIGSLSSVVMNSDDQFDLLDYTNDDVPKWLSIWNIDPENFRADPDLARGTMYGIVKQAASLRTLPGSPIRVSAQNIANGGVDEAAFGYWAIEEHHPAGILKVTYAPAVA